MQTLATIRKYYESQPSYIVDPHTAVGLTVAQTISSDSAYVIRVPIRHLMES